MTERIGVGTTYLDHAGTTPYARSLVDHFSENMMSCLLGNPHSLSTSSQTSTRRIDDVRHKVLQFFSASPDDFDVVFVANATAGIKLVVEAFRGHERGFWYGYHKDAHTSLVGARQLATGGHHCFESDSEVETWLRGEKDPMLNYDNNIVGLFTYPAQSNMNGRRLPLAWSSRLRSSSISKGRQIYTLLDAATLVSTSPLDLSDANSAPDFTVLSFYKIFGFPDLGALIVRKDAEPSLRYRQYFGGGTVEMVTCLTEQWHIKKTASIHDQLEDGTLPVHSILALDSALNTHRKLFGSMNDISSHTSFLAQRLYDGLSSLRHADGGQVCTIYKDSASIYSDCRTQGPVIAFNIRNSAGIYISNSEVEKLAGVKNIQLRTGGLCNPGGIASSLGLAPWDMKENFSAGQRCGNDNDTIHGKPTGMTRVSLGAMSTIQDISLFIAFIDEFFVENGTFLPHMSPELPVRDQSSFYVDSLMIYPIKSCGGWSVPASTQWAIRPEGLAWDREWCLIHQGTRNALSQKQYPKMALLRPSIDFTRGILHIRYEGRSPPETLTEVSVPLSGDPSVIDREVMGSLSRYSRVCGESITIRIYSSELLATFFTSILETPCTLARSPTTSMTASFRHSKAHLQPHQLAYSNTSQDYHFPSAMNKRPILLSNESPILTITRSSLDALNARIKEHNADAKVADALLFRANITLAQKSTDTPASPYYEDKWRSMRIIPRQSTRARDLRETELEMLGSCRRCQMVCIDQKTAERNEEPLATLSKTRRMGGKVWFGVHGGLARGSKSGTIAVGDTVLGLQ